MIVVRELLESENQLLRELGRIAFGGARPAADAPPPPPRPGRIHYGAFDGDRIVAGGADRIQSHWYAGRLVPACGLASVAVAPADRGAGHAKTLLTALMTAARERGAAIMTLFPSAPALYHQLGCEQVGHLTLYDLPTLALSRVRVPAGWSTRAASSDDSSTIAGLYTEVAAAGHGYADRTGPLFPNPLETLDGVTLAVTPEGTIEGYAGWTRGEGFGPEARLTVSTFIATTSGATETLLASLGSWAAVTPTLTLWLAPGDPVFWALPASGLRMRELHPWMLRVLDAQRAVGARGWPTNAEVSVDLTITDDLCPWNAGDWRLEVSGGRGALVPGAGGGVMFGPRGLAVAFAGGTTAAALRRGGLLTGPTTQDARLDAVLAGPPPTLLDDF